MRNTLEDATVAVGRQAGRSLPKTQDAQADEMPQGLNTQRRPYWPPTVGPTAGPPMAAPTAAPQASDQRWGRGSAGCCPLVEAFENPLFMLPVPHSGKRRIGAAHGGRVHTSVHAFEHDTRVDISGADQLACDAWRAACRIQTTQGQQSRPAWIRFSGTSAHAMLAVTTQIPLQSAPLHSIAHVKWKSAQRGTACEAQILL